MASKDLNRICKVILFSGILLLLKTFFNLPLLWNTGSVKTFQPKNGQPFTGIWGKDFTNDKRTKVLDDSHVYKSKRKRDSQIKVIKKGKARTKSTEKTNMGGLYGSNCPPNPHKRALKYLLHYWIALDDYYDFYSFLCGGSLIGSLRDGDLIPYDRDIDVCMTMENYKKLRLIRTGKPFDHRSGQIFLAVQENFANDDVSNRTRVDCRGFERHRSRDPCTFQSPGARLIFREIYVDVFVFREHGEFLRDHEYDKKFLKRDIFPLKHCTFMGINVKCPHNEMGLLLKYYEPDVVTKPHYMCRNNAWVATSPHAQQQFKIWFSKRLQQFIS